MKAADVMATNVITVRQDTPVTSIAEVLLANRISAVPVLSWSDAFDVHPSEAFYHVSARFLDRTLAEELMGQYLIDGARFDIAPTPGAAEAVVALDNKAGEPVAWFKWQPDRPGTLLLAETAPAMGIAVLVAGLVIAMHWPVNSLWVLGLFLAIDLVFQGWSFIAFGLALKR